jgi:hypothetical protein
MNAGRDADRGSRASCESGAGDAAAAPRVRGSTRRVYARRFGPETWLDERPRTFTGGSTRDIYAGPYARCAATDEPRRARRLC